MDKAGLVIKMDPVTFAKRFREARLAAKLTQQQIADACGISNRTVSAWEAGRAEGILAENLFCVADTLHVDPRWLATGQVEITTALHEIVRGLESLPAEQQEAVRALVKSLKS